MSNDALLLTDGMLETVQAKTAHGLILGSSRYNIRAVIDSVHAGKDAGLVICGKEKNIPVFSSLEHALQQLEKKPQYCVVGVAPIGGLFSASLIQTLTEAASAGINLVSGLHSLLSEQPLIASLAREKGIELIDIRKPKPLSQLAMWTGKINALGLPRIAVIGTDCAIGKRTTASLLLALCEKQQIRAEMIYTGQTGWLQNRSYGFILDATLNDFVAGEMENAILRCAEEARPELIFIEGQSSLRNPGGPCGAELLCCAGAKYAILQHSPARKYFACDTTDTCEIPDLREEIALVSYYGAKVVAITLNSRGLRAEQLPGIKQDLQEKTQLPVVYPREEGVEALLPLLMSIMQDEISP